MIYDYDFNLYISSIKKDVLNKGENHELLRKAKHDKSFVSDAIAHNIGLILSVIKDKKTNVLIDRFDLFQEACIVFITSLMSWNEKGAFSNHFMTYSISPMLSIFLGNILFLSIPRGSWDKMSKYEKDELLNYPFEESLWNETYCRNSKEGDRCDIVENVLSILPSKLRFVLETIDLKDVSGSSLAKVMSSEFGGNLTTARVCQLRKEAIRRIRKSNIMPDLINLHNETRRGSNGKNRPLHEDNGTGKRPKEQEKQRSGFSKSN